jgi:outer membrane protein OmpA-like peptidoglycan-associated protein
MMTGMTAVFLIVACAAILMWMMDLKTQVASASNVDRNAVTNAGDGDARFPAAVQDDGSTRHAGTAADTGLARLAGFRAALTQARRKVGVLSQQYGFTLDPKTDSVDLGTAAIFPLGSDRLSADQEALLRNYIVHLVDLVHDDPTMFPLKNITVMGYTDPAGSYLFNLDLSARRSERLMCALLDPAQRGTEMTDAEVRTIRRLIKVGGYSIGDPGQSAQKNRRLALKLDFYGFDEPHLPGDSQATPTGACPLRMHGG